MRKVIAATMTMGLMVLSASAQLGPHQMHLQIPFAFHVNEMTLTPGWYGVEAVSTDIVRLTNTADKKSVLVITPLKGDGQSHRPTLIFNRYGSDYFLSKMWFSQGASARAFIPTPVERELAKNTRRPAQIESVSASQ